MGTTGKLLITARRQRAREVRRYLALYLAQLDSTIWDATAQAIVPISDLQRVAREQNAMHYLAQAQVNLSSLTDLHLKAKVNEDS
jgi:hypothetical protein